MRLQWPPVNDLIHQNASIASSCITTQSVHLNFYLPYQRWHSSGIYTQWVFHKVLAQFVQKVKSIHCGETSPISSEETTFLAPVPYCPPRWLRKGRSRCTWVLPSMVHRGGWERVGVGHGQSPRQGSCRAKRRAGKKPPGCTAPFNAPTAHSLELLPSQDGRAHQPRQSTVVQMHIHKYTQNTNTNTDHFF